MKPVFIGKDQIMKFYDSVNPDGKLAYSVWFGDKPMLQCPGDMDNEEKCRDLLALNCEAWDTTGFDNVLWLRFHPAQTEPITRKTPVLIAQPIAFGEDTDEQIINGAGNRVAILKNNSAGMNMQMFRAIDTLEKLPDTIKTHIDERMKDYDDRLKAIEQPIKEEPGTLAQIGSFINSNPGVVTEVLTFLKGIIPSMPQPIQQTSQMAINGAPPMDTTQQPQQTQEPAQPKEIDNDKLNTALDRLETKMVLDEDLMLLADFADREPQQFEFLLNMLRNNKA